MAVDIRATVTCSLGTLINGSLSDDYIQGSGLVKTRGSVEISGTITPAIGTAVTFSYTKGGVTRSIPRKLRVMSSFADPFRRTTKVELGCKLTYLSDLQEQLNWDAFDDSANSGFTETDALIVTLPISASSVMAKCLTELGITASSSPLTNKFSVAEFDFGAGYVQVLSDLLVSESYCGYLDANEVLQIFSLNQEAGTGPVYASTDIIDLGPINTGQLPGEAVTVSYSSLKLKTPDSSTTGSSSDPWVYTVTRGSEQSIRVAGNDYTYIPETTTETEYETTGERRITKKTVTKRTIAAEAGGSYLETIYAELGTFPIAPSTVITETETTVYEYDVGSVTVQLPTGSWYYTSGDITRSITLTEESKLRVIASLNLPWVIGSNSYAASTDKIISRKRVVTDETVSGYTRSITDDYSIYGYTQEGQQLAAAVGQNIETIGSLTTYINTLLGSNALVLDNTNVSVNFGDSRLNNRLPSQADINNAAYANGGDPNNGWRTESVADIELAVGSATAQRRIELSMPYAPDDVFSGPSGGPFTAVASDAPVKATVFGRVQNRLLLGNRNGINLQLAPEKLPAAPFAPMYVQANGLTALYRANGNQWAFSSDGIVCSTDALFWAAIGGTGTFWFPVAPGVTTLPTTPAIVNGEMSPSTTVLPYNETAVYDAVLRTQLEIVSIGYALALLTEIPAIVVKSEVEIRKITKIDVPAASIGVAAQLPTVSTGFIARPTALVIQLEPAVPFVSGGASVAVPASDIAVAAGDAPEVPRPATVVSVPAIDVAVAGTLPVVVSGASVAVPVSDISIAAAVPSSVGESDPNFSSVSLLLHMDGSNGSTTFTDNSSNALSVTALNGAAISTTQSKFGGASGTFDGTDNYLTVATNTLLSLPDDFTIEFWFYANASTAGGVFANGASGFSGTAANIVYDHSTATDRICLFHYPSNSSARLCQTGVLSLSTWYHVAFVRSGTTVTAYLDGTAGTSGTSSQTFNFSATETRIGRSYSGYVNAYIDELRVTKGVARYTAAFTAPTLAFPNQ